MRRILVVTALAVIPAARAIAADSKIYPASMCQPASASHAARASFNNNGRVCNVSEAATLVLRCPVVRDLVAGHISHVRVYAKTGDPDGVPCTLRSLRPDTEEGHGWYQQLTIPLGPGNDPDAWSSAQSFADMGETADGAFELTCTLPAATPWTSGLKQSCLGTYRVEETE